MEKVYSLYKNVEMWKNLNLAYFDKYLICLNVIISMLKVLQRFFTFFLLQLQWSQYSVHFLIYQTFFHYRQTNYFFRQLLNCWRIFKQKLYDMYFFSSLAVYSDSLNFMQSKKISFKNRFVFNIKILFIVTMLTDT